MAHSVWTGGSRHPGRAALPHKNIHIVALEAKLNEEVAEYQADKNLEEMADVLEVLQAICIARGYSLEELEALRVKKASERGGFADKIFLEYVE